MSNICMSGGAIGADFIWGTCAKEHGHQVIHWSFKNSKHNVDDVFVLNDEELKVADPFLINANKTLQRHLPFDKPWIINLLRRNYYQVAESSSVYAISTIKNNIVDGGTSWAVTMSIDIGNKNVYVFDQNLNQWFQWNDTWIVIDKPPKPSGIYAGIGTRKINENGINAIIQIYQD